MVIFKGEKGYERAAGAKFFGYMTILKGEIGVRARRRRENFGTPDFSNLGSQFLPKSQFLPVLSPKIKSITPSLRGWG